MTRIYPAGQRQLLFNGALLYMFIGAIACVWILLRGGYQLLHERLIGPTPWQDLLIGAGVGLAAVACSRVLARWSRKARDLEIALARVLGPVSVRSCLLLALFSGCSEELLFRAALQPECGLVAASIIFAILHFPFEKGLLLWTVFALVMGFVLGGLYEWLGNALAPMAMHVVVNACNLNALQVHWRPTGVLGNPERSEAREPAPPPPIP